MGHVSTLYASDKRVIPHIRESRRGGRVSRTAAQDLHRDDCACFPRSQRKALTALIHVRRLYSVADVELKKDIRQRKIAWREARTSILHPKIDGAAAIGLD